MMSEHVPGDRFPFGKEQRRSAAKENERKITGFLPTAAEDIRKGHYDWVDSQLDAGDKQWGASFFDSFEPVLPNGTRSLQTYLEETLADKKGHAIGIEFGGVGSRLFSDFTEGFFEKSLGVTLADHRQILKKDPSFRRDERIHHTVREADIFSLQLKEYLDTWLAGRRADLIIKRIAKGMEFVPQDPNLLAETLQEWWDLLAEGGILLAQIPVALNPVFEPWMKMLKEKYQNDLNPEYALGTNDDTLFASVLRLRKLNGALPRLPMLDARMVREISKKNAGRGV